MNQIWLYDLFRKELRLPDDKAAAFVKAIEDVAESEGAGKTHLLATKKDVLDLELKIEQSKNAVYKAMLIAAGILELIAILSGTLAIVKFAK